MHPYPLLIKSLSPALKFLPVLNPLPRFDREDRYERAYFLAHQSWIVNAALSITMMLAPRRYLRMQ